MNKPKAWTGDNRKFTQTPVAGTDAENERFYFTVEDARKDNRNTHIFELNRDTGEWEIAPQQSGPLLNDEEYVAKGGQNCPWCNSTDIEGHGADADGTVAWLDVECGACKAEWQEMFHLVGYGQLKVADGRHFQD